MAFDFRRGAIGKVQSFDLIIKIDDEIFDPTKLYNYRVNSVFFENSNGLVIIKDLNQSLPASNKIPDLIKIQKDSVQFDSTTLNSPSSRMSFQEKEVIIQFKKIPQDVDLSQNPNFLEYLKANGVILSGRKENELILTSPKIVNVNLRPFLDNPNAQINRGFQIGLNNDEDLFMSQGKKRYKNEAGQDRNFYSDDLMMDQSVQIENMLIEEAIPQEVEQVRHFIDFTADDSEFDNTLENAKKIPDSKIATFIDPYASEKADNINKKLNKFRLNFANAFRANFNHKGEFITRGAFDKNKFHFKMNINKVTPNENLLIKKQETKDNTLLGYYVKNTIVNYLSNLNDVIKSKNEYTKKSYKKESNYISLSPIAPNVTKESVLFRTEKKSHFMQELSEVPEISADLLSVNDYSVIIQRYIDDLTRNRDQIKSFNLGDEDSKVKSSNLYQNFEKEISTLKLFKLLFLNCYFDKANSSYSEKDILSLKEEVKRMRKKKLLDWLTDNAAKEGDIKIKEMENKVRSEDDYYKLILHCLVLGKLRKAVELANKKGLLNLSMLMSQSNREAKAKLIEESLNSWSKSFNQLPPTLKLIYDLLSGKHNTEITTYCDWRNVIIYNSIFTFPLSASIKVVHTQMISNLNDESLKSRRLPVTNNYTKTTNDNIYLLLISLYSSFEDSNSETYAKSLLNQICDTSSLFSNFTDHHLQYILVTILLNTLKESYDYSHLKKENPIGRSVTDMKYLKQLHFKLLVKVVEELMIYESQLNNGSWKVAINLIKHSNVSERMKHSMTNAVVTKYIEKVVRDTSYFSHNDFTPFKRGAKALHNYYEGNYAEAYVNFKLANYFEMASEIYIFRFLCASLLTENITNETAEEINLLNSKSSYYWTKYGTVIKEFVMFENKYNQAKDKLSQNDFSEIINLLKKLEVLNTTADITNFNLINACRDFMISKLRRIYNHLSHAFKLNENFNLTITPNMTWIADKNLSQTTKINEFNYSLDSLHLQKVKTFKIK